VLVLLAVLATLQHPVATATPEVSATSAPGESLPPVPILPTVAPVGAAPSADIVGVASPFVGLSLGDAIGMGLAHNTDLALSRSNRRIAGFRIAQAQGAYDLRLQIQPSYSFTQQPPLSSFDAGPNGAPLQIATAAAQAGISGLTSSGGRISASTSAQRIDNNLAVNSYDPYYETAFALTFSQPLARGRRIDEAREQIALARINSDVSSDEALIAASSTVESVSVAYDNLVAAWKNVAIQEDALRQARAQSESNGRLVRRGAAAPVEVVQSNQQVQQFQDDVFSAIQNVATLQNQLKGLILSDPADPVWDANLVPTTPVAAAAVEPRVEDVVVAALAKRPEIDRLRNDLRGQDVTLAFARDQIRPQIDLNVGITENGFAGAPLSPANNPITSIIGAQVGAIDALIARANAAAPPGTPPLVPIPVSGLNAPFTAGSVGKLGAAYRSAFAGQYPVYQISATIGIPLRDRSARSAYEAALEQRRSIVTQELGLVQRFEVEARNAVQSLRSARSRVVAAAAARAAAERVEQSEVRKFRAGESTTFLVLQRQVFLASARGRELQAQTDVANALVEIDRVTGSILANNRVAVGELGSAAQGSVPDLLHAPAAPSPSAAPAPR